MLQCLWEGDVWRTVDATVVSMDGVRLKMPHVRSDPASVSSACWASCELLCRRMGQLQRRGWLPRMSFFSYRMHRMPAWICLWLSWPVVFQCKRYALSQKARSSGQTSKSCPPISTLYGDVFKVLQHWKCHPCLQNCRNCSPQTQLQPGFACGSKLTRLL